MAELCPDNNNPLTAANTVTSQSTIVSDVNKAVSAATPMYDITNKLVKAAIDYNAFNSVVNQLIGYDSKWFRAIPQQRSRDVIFQEYTLSNVEECPLDVKVVVPSGMPPDSKYNYDLMGLEYEVPFEVQIDKKYWESLAGFGTAPQKKDIVYFPISNKLFQVESAYLFRGFMEQETTWKLNLTKYQPQASRREPVSLQNTINDYTVSVEELFGEAIDNDVKKLVDDQQFNQHNSMTKDKYKSFDVSLNTISKPIEMYGTIVAQSYYDLQTSYLYDAITYNAIDLIGDHDDRSIIAWAMPRTISSMHKEYSVTSITPIISLDPCTFYVYDASLYSQANYSVVLNNPVLLSQIQIDDYITISRPGALNFYAKVVAISVNPLTFHCLINAFVQEDLAAIKADWNIQTGYKLTVKAPISILDGVNDFGEHVFSVNIFANQYIAINYGHTYDDEDAYVIKLDEKLNDDQWYGFVVNIGNTWKQYNIYVWEKHETDKNAKLQNVYYETLRLYPEEISVAHYSINRSPAYLTNLRLYNSTIEEEKMSNELLTYFISDAEQAIIADNCDPRLRLAYITKQR
jgi:hypothetical protein